MNAILYGRMHRAARVSPPWQSPIGPRWTADFCLTTFRIFIGHHVAVSPSLSCFVPSALSLSRIPPNTENLSGFWGLTSAKKSCSLYLFSPSQSRMADSGKRKAKAGDLGADPSSWRLAAEESDGGQEFELAAEDPLLALGSEIMTMIIGKVDVRSAAVARLVSRGWQAVASSDRIWAPKEKKASCRCTGEMEAYNMVSQACRELWLSKAHLPRLSMVQGLPKMVASLLSIRDGKRTRITRDDLCDHVWEFHFTESAPEYWRDLDPYWRGAGTPMRRFFHPDGSITADSDDKVWGGHESSYTIVTGLLSGGKVREHYVRINRWPKMTVHRNPDWSWVLRNHLYCYTSVPDADREDGTGPSAPVSGPSALNLDV